MPIRDITSEEFEQMLEDLESGKFVPLADNGDLVTTYPSYCSCWYDYLEGDDLAYDVITEQYVKSLFL